VWLQLCLSSLRVYFVFFCFICLSLSLCLHGLGILFVSTSNVFPPEVAFYHVQERPGRTSVQWPQIRLNGCDVSYNILGTPWVRF